MFIITHEGSEMLLISVQDDLVNIVTQMSHINDIIIKAHA